MGLSSDSSSFWVEWARKGQTWKVYGDFLGFSPPKKTFSIIPGLNSEVIAIQICGDFKREIVDVYLDIMG